MCYWPKAVKTAVDQINLLPSRSQNLTTPYSKWHNKSFNYEFLKPFGCLCFGLTPDFQLPNKFAPCGFKGILLGFLNDFSTYKILNLQTSTIHSLKHVHFIKHIFPGLLPSPSSHASFSFADPFFELPSDPLLSPNPHSPPSSMKSHSSPAPSNPLPPSISSLTQPTQNKFAQIQKEVDSSNIISGKRAAVVLLVQPVLNTVINPSVHHVELEKIPRSYKEAISCPDFKKWLEAINKEIANLSEHQVFALVDTPSGVRPLDCTWVFKIKKDKNNKNCKYKANSPHFGFSLLLRHITISNSIRSTSKRRSSMHPFLNSSTSKYLLAFLINRTNSFALTRLSTV